MKSWLWYALLENGHSVECTDNRGGADFSIGQIIQTQWGPRSVVSVFTINLDDVQEPFGV